MSKAKSVPGRKRRTKAEVAEFLAPYAPQVRGLAIALRGLVFQVVPEAIEQLDPAAELIGYGLDRTYKATVCVIMPLRAAVNLGFPRGVDLDDPDSLLEGTGKRARHVKLLTLEAVFSEGVHNLLAQSASLVRGE